MNRKDYETIYVNNATLTDRQREQRTEIFKKNDGKRRKLNVVGGLISAVATLYICKEYAHIDYTQALTDTDKMTIAVIYMALLMMWRFIRQKIMAVTTPTDVYGAEERKAVAEMTPQQARQYLREEKELQNAYHDGKRKGNTLFIILVPCAIAFMLYLIDKGVL